MQFLLHLTNMKSQGIPESKLVAIEAIALAQAADLRARKDVMGSDYQKLYNIVRSVSPTLQQDRPLTEEIARVTALLQSEDVQQQCLDPDAEHETD